MKFYELSARYDSRKSFYGKAHVIDHGNALMSSRAMTLLFPAASTVLSSTLVNGVRPQPAISVSLKSSLHIKEAAQ